MDFTSAMKIKILFTTNGKKHSDDAISFASDIFSVLDVDATIFFVGKKEIGRAIVKRGRDIAIDKSRGNSRVSTKIVEGRKITSAILKEIKTGSYDILVIGSRGASSTIPGVSSYVLGDVPRDVIISADISTFIIKEPAGLQKVLLAIDGSRASKNAALFWGQIVKNAGRRWKDQEINILTVIPEQDNRFLNSFDVMTEDQLLALGSVPGRYTKGAHRVKSMLLARENVNSHVILRGGDVVEEVLAETEKDYDLIVLGRNDTAQETFGVHLQHIVEQVKIPALIVRESLIEKITTQKSKK